MDETGRRLASRRLPEGLAGIGEAPSTLIADHAEEPDQVVIGIETDRGLWVEALTAAGYQVFAVNPLAVARYRDRHHVSGAFGLRRASGVRGQPDGAAQAALALGHVVVNRQKERSSLSTRRLLDAAGELISEGGYAAMTLAAVGERAGYSRGLVTARFGSKRELVEALVERITTVWNARNVQPGTVAGAASTACCSPSMRSVCSPSVTRVHLRTLYALQFEALGQVPELRSHFVEFHRTMRADMAGFVRRGLRDGSVVAGTSPKAEGAAVVGALRGIGYQWLLDPDEIDPSALLSHLIVCLDRRLRARRRQPS